ncbi:MULTISPECIES: DNA phosphorothioation-dependent restriction protein DptG [unclassified Beijerinckia]|uniref:DNA phosphorothioation-dependent restriction protein DptG n=1 Tax=unclassified Beijerinckia TaxID=2638183 RepID=UPI0008994F28|nr:MULTISPECIES: DNA phosphorothioation-dependent restriction protein DptG [unclassified Beijerinckia]MDH7796398.1 DNA phosphorothioation-dependent restriction protein DptG [Beijerinckia sp. GAS462]SEC43433.1 DNA phosphorothioation-dependent restriction protein DptG [Beijerinckia sp. 28-YEA-48]
MSEEQFEALVRLIDDRIDNAIRALKCDLNDWDRPPRLWEDEATLKDEVKELLVRA